MRSTAAVTGRAQCAGSSTKPWSTTLQAVEAAAEAYPEIRLGRRRKAEASSQVQDVPFPLAVSERCFLHLHTNNPHTVLCLFGRSNGPQAPESAVPTDKRCCAAAGRHCAL